MKFPLSKCHTSGPQFVFAENCMLSYLTPWTSVFRQRQKELFFNIPKYSDSGEFNWVWACPSVRGVWYVVHKALHTVTYG